MRREKIRTLIADDSATFRGVLRRVLESAGDIDVVGEAVDGASAVRLARALQPDVLTLDVSMPGVDGLGALEELMRIAPTPVVVLSAAAGTSPALSFRALELGALEVLGKPRGGEAELRAGAEEIRNAVRVAAGVKVLTRRRVPTTAGVPTTARGHRAAMVGIAASTGGPAALVRILPALPADYPLPILIVQHMARGFQDAFVAWLARSSGRRVKLAADGEVAAAGGIYVAPDGDHLEVSGGRLQLLRGPPIDGFRPSATALFASLARELGAGAAGLVLSGMGRDGAAGLLRLRAAGGYAAAQGPATSVVYGMPREALECGAAAVSLELDDIPAALVQLASPPSPER
jgi:two-component system chemotaxis response regulator CheB